LDKEHVFSHLTELPIPFTTEALSDLSKRNEAFQFEEWALNNNLLDRRYNILDVNHFPLLENDDELPF
jgi:hypothetical protein